MKAQTEERAFNVIVGVLFGVLVGILFGELGHAVYEEPEYPARASARIIETTVHGQDLRAWVVKVMGHMTASPDTEELCAGSLINEIKVSVIGSNTWDEIRRAVETHLALNGETLDYGFGWSLICRFKTMSVHVSGADRVFE